ncbi:hypothetical protein Rhopal_007678-T1 [Rhodotorula paludigena]|uniref:Uncharacterized protein n=1 Tax=Rhodotorula paludigena TaxID=86838 RepID=A0AAV5GPT9_9BASI|nr:hypothetical protein Rhopal_007678-T1 [Rhodotorula paludigena]
MSASQHAASAGDLSLKAFMDSVDNLGEAFLRTFAGQGNPPAPAKTIKDHFSAWKRPWYLRLVSAPTQRHVTFPWSDPDGGLGWNLLCEADKSMILSVLQWAQHFLAQHRALPVFQQGSIMQVLAEPSVHELFKAVFDDRYVFINRAERLLGSSRDALGNLRYAKDMAAQKKRREEADKEGRFYKPRKTIPVPEPMPRVQQWFVEQREEYNKSWRERLASVAPGEDSHRKDGVQEDHKKSNGPDLQYDLDHYPGVDPSHSPAHSLAHANPALTARQRAHYRMTHAGLVGMRV